MCRNFTNGWKISWTGFRTPALMAGAAIPMHTELSKMNLEDIIYPTNFIHHSIWSVISISITVSMANNETSLNSRYRILEIVWYLSANCRIKMHGIYLSIRINVLKLIFYDFEIENFKNLAFAYIYKKGRNRYQITNVMNHYVNN